MAEPKADDRRVGRNGIVHLASDWLGMRSSNPFAVECSRSLRDKELVDFPFPNSLGVLSESLGDWSLKSKRSADFPAEQLQHCGPRCGVRGRYLRPGATTLSKYFGYALRLIRTRCSLTGGCPFVHEEYSQILWCRIPGGVSIPCRLELSCTRKLIGLVHLHLWIQLKYASQ